MGIWRPRSLRLAPGGLLAGPHGARKLFGSCGGPGLQGTGGFMEMLGLKPGRPRAVLAGLSEFGGGVLTVLGFLSPLGFVAVIYAGFGTPEPPQEEEAREGAAGNEDA